jgi:hypothetical protein
MTFFLAGCRKEKVDPTYEYERLEHQALLREALQSPTEHPLMIYIVPERGQNYLAVSTTNRLAYVSGDYLCVQGKERKFHVLSFASYNAKFLPGSSTDIEYMEMYFKEK